MAKMQREQVSVHATTESILDAILSQPTPVAVSVRTPLTDAITERDTKVRNEVLALRHLARTRKRKVGLSRRYFVLCECGNESCWGSYWVDQGPSC